MSVRGKRRKQKATQFYLDSSKEEACFMLCKTVNEKWQWRETDMMIKQWGKDFFKKSKQKTPNKSEINRICLILHINGSHEHKLFSLLNSCNLHFGRKNRSSEIVLTSPDQLMHRKANFILSIWKLHIKKKFFKNGILVILKKLR